MAAKRLSNEANSLESEEQERDNIISHIFSSLLVFGCVGKQFSYAYVTSRCAGYGYQLSCLIDRRFSKL